MKRIIPLIVLSCLFGLLAGCIHTTQSDAVSLIVKQLRLKSDSYVREIEPYCFIVRTEDGAVIYVKVDIVNFPPSITERRWLFDGTNSNTTTENKDSDETTKNVTTVMALEKKE